MLPAAFAIPKKETKSKQKYAQAFDESTVQYYYCIYLAALSSPYGSANTELSSVMDLEGFPLFPSALFSKAWQEFSNALQKSALFMGE